MGRDDARFEKYRENEATGGAEAHARWKQYDYKAMSTQVLTADGARRNKDPKGEPETLHGRINPRTFGDKVERSQPEELAKREKGKGDKRVRFSADGEGPEDEFQKLRGQKRRGVESVLTMEAGGLYRPKTRETRAAYEAMLGTLQQQLGDQPADVLRSAADEVLAVLKSDTTKDVEKKKSLEGLINGISSERFAQLVALGKLMNDYVDPEEARLAAEAGIDDDLGVAVEFEGEDEEDDDGENAVVVEEEEDDDGIPGQNGAVKTGINDEDMGEDEEEKFGVQTIDAYWLQREITKSFPDIDASAGQKLSEDVLEALGADDDRLVENKLVMLLDYDKFNLIKFLTQNRLKIVWCTRLARAQGEDEALAIEEKMMANADTAAILEKLRASRLSARERESALANNIRKEARRLKGENGVGEGAIDAQEVEGQGRQILDLDVLAFGQGARTMTNKSCDLPEGSYREMKKGFEAVYVPALKPSPYEKGEKLVKISELPAWTHAAFKGMESLNRVQSRVANTALYAPDNMLICAPTGAGKTNCSMLTILHEIGLHRLEDGTIDTSAFKIVYVAPMKALVAEIVGNLGKRLAAYGMIVRELTGDISLSKSQIDETQIIVTTPEKWDIVTRKSGDRTYTQLVSLMIIDEIHLLHDNRGPVLESLVARTVRQVESTQEMIRLVGLSATLPNYTDVATFLRVNPEKGLFFFDNSYRPVQLNQQYIGVTVKKPLQRFQLMNEICYERVLDCAGRHQVLIFVHSRKETAKTARALRDAAMGDDSLGRFLKEDSASREILQSECESIKNADLKDILPYGFAMHHAGMTRTDRTLVEELFGDGHIQVLVSTATLAWGVNLPAHTVIIKGTQVYSPEKGGWDEISPLDVMQMMGRAGRPQFDSSGEGIIITEHQNLQFYLSLFNQQLSIESQYISDLPDNLNAEVVLGTVQNTKEAADWLTYTYLYVRMLRNPQLYGVPLDSIESDPTLADRRADLVHTAATQLDSVGMVRYDRRSCTLQPTELGRVASHYYVSHRTMQSFNEHLKPTMTEIQLCRVFALADEFRYIGVREEEKMELVRLVERVPVPVKENLDDPAAKINILLQAYISQLKLDGLALMADMVYVTQSAGRLMRAIYEIVLRRGWAQLACRTLSLCKMINRRMWASQNPLRQFPKMPRDILQKLEKKDIAWERYYDLSSQELGELVRTPRVGKTLHKFIHQFPRLELAAHVQPITRSVLKVDLTLTPDFRWDKDVHGFVESFWIIVEDCDSETILHHEFFMLKMQYVEDDSQVSFTVPITEPLPPQYFVRVISDRWIGCEMVLPVSFRHLILPSKYAPPTELLDLQPLPVSALGNAKFEALYRQKNISIFNPIQTQVFSSLYNSDDNVLVGAPTGSGKSVCAEFAILRMLNQNPESRCVYIAPTEAILQERLADWGPRLGSDLGLSIVSLVGESATDLKLLERGQIIMATPQQWDMLSRRWKQRKNVKYVKLLIADELHLIGGEHGPVLEIIISRMRYIGNHVEAPCRIVALSTSLANAKELGDWMGVSSHGLFNFHPGVRPVPLEISIKGFEVANYDARLQAMIRPCYSTIASTCSIGKPAIVFVPTRKHTKRAALELLTVAAADGNPNRFRMCAVEDIEPYLEKVEDRTLKHSLQFGVAILHEATSAGDREIAETLFATDAIQVLVASASLCWELTQTSHLVVVLGTQYFDSSTGTGGADYPITDILQIMGRASRPGIDDRGHCSILCHAPKKEYYKRFIYEPYPVESHLNHFLHDPMCAEIVTHTVESKQDAVDYLTWSFLYRRLTRNPNYYNLTGTSHRHLSDFLSELVESTLADLETSKCISIEEEMDLAPLNLGMIASYYYITYTTIELFNSSLTAKTKVRGLLEILSSATEYEVLPSRPGDEEAVRKVLAHAKLSLEQPRYTDPHVKANALFQAHFSRRRLGSDLSADQKVCLLEAPRLLQATIDVISSSGWLNPALAAMELSQMVTQGLWASDNVLMQIPHLTRAVAENLTESREIEGVFDLVEHLSELKSSADRQELLGDLSTEQMEEVAIWCRRYPNIDLSYEIENDGNVVTNDTCTVVVTLERDLQGADMRPVDAPRFPKQKDEAWWVVIGKPETNSLLAIKRFVLGMKQKVKLEMPTPETEGKHEYTLFFMCDSYLGCDQEYSIELVAEAGSDDDDEGEEMEEGE